MIIIERLINKSLFNVKSDSEIKISSLSLEETLKLKDILCAIDAHELKNYETFTQLFYMLKLCDLHLKVLFS